MVRILGSLWHCYVGGLYIVINQKGQREIIKTVTLTNYKGHSDLPPINRTHYLNYIQHFEV
jgi:hypothetical protein